MGKFAVLSSLILATCIASAFQTPAQQSGNIVNSVVQSILSDNGLELMSITKINVSNGYAKAQLTGRNGQCLALPYKVSYDNQGLPSVEIDKAALAVCD